MNWENDIKFIENKMGRRRVKTKERKRKCNDKLASSGEIKRQKGRGKIGKSVTVDVNYNREKKNFFFFLRIGGIKV